MSTPSMSKTHALHVLPMALMLLVRTPRPDQRRPVGLILGTRCRDAGGLRRILPVMHAEDRPHDDHHVEQGFARVRLPPGKGARIHVEPQEGNQQHHQDGAQDDDAGQSLREPKSLRPTKRTGSQRTSATRSLSGMIALSVMWMCSGHTSVQHLVMLQ